MSSGSGSGWSDPMTERESTPARRKFRIGQRVRYVPACGLTLRSKANGAGTVVGFTDSPLVVLVVPDNYRSVKRYHEKFWEPVK